MNKPAQYLILLFLVLLITGPVTANETGTLHYPLENIQISAGYPDIPDDNLTLTDVTDEITLPKDDFRTYLITAYSRQFGLPPVFVTELIALFFLLFGSGAIAFLHTRSRPDSDDPDAKSGQILAAIRNNPGITFSELRTLTGYSRSSLTHHLLSLEHYAQLITISSGGTTHYYPISNGLNLKEERLRLLLTGENPHTIFRTIMDHPEISQKQLIETTGIPQTTCQWHLSNLLGEHIITKEKKKNSICYKVTPENIRLYRAIVGKQ